MVAAMAYAPTELRPLPTAVSKASAVVEDGQWWEEWGVSSPTATGKWAPPALVPQEELNVGAYRSFVTGVMLHVADVLWRDGTVMVVTGT